MRGFQGIPSRHSDIQRRGRTADPLLLTPEPFPSGENHEGVCWGWSPNTQRMELRFPHVVFGPGALDSSTGNIALTTDTWVPLYTAVPGDGIGMRGGMVGYLPRGRWGCFGHVAIASADTTKNYYIRIRQGTAEGDPTNQPKIIGGSPITLAGGGLGISPATANFAFSIAFSCSDIQCALERDFANEVWVEVYAESTAAGAGAALASSSVMGNGTITKITFIRWNGQHGAE